METLIEKLRSLGVSIGRTNLDFKTREKYTIENVIKGEWLHSKLGDIFKVSEIYSTGYEHGRMTLENRFSFSKVLEVSGIHGNGITLEEILFIDTETTGLSGGTGTMAFLVGLGYFSKTGFIIEQYFLDEPVSELGLINAVSNIVSKYKVIVTFNGSSFDIPLLKTRFVINRMNSPFQQKPHLDLLHLSRKIWKLRLASLKLKNLENEILQFQREEDEVPGWMVPQMYFDFIRSRDARPLRGVFYHNRMDVLSLALLFNLASSLLSDPLRNMNVPKEDMLSIARLIERHGDTQQSKNLYEATFRNGLPENLSAGILLRYGFICRRNSNIDLALNFWKSSFDKGEYRAAVEISKIYEYQAKDFPNALIWAKHSFDLFQTNQLENTPSDFIQDTIMKRIKRIEIKINKNHEKT